MEDNAPVHLRNAAFGWTKEKQAESAVGQLSLTIEPATLTVIVGPVGCGKSTFLQGLLSENIQIHGIVSVRVPRIAYCGQTPWISNATVRQNIIGCSPYDARRYQEGIEACGLNLSIFVQGDERMLGSGGSSISGGQKQRVVRSLLSSVWISTSIADKPFCGL